MDKVRSERERWLNEPLSRTTRPPKMKLLHAKFDSLEEKISKFQLDNSSFGWLSHADLVSFTQAEGFVAEFEAYFDHVASSFVEAAHSELGLPRKTK